MTATDTEEGITLERSHVEESQDIDSEEDSGIQSKAEATPKKASPAQNLDKAPLKNLRQDVSDPFFVIQ